MTYFIESAWGYCMVGGADIHNLLSYWLLTCWGL